MMQIFQRGRSAKRVLVITHRNADVDGIASAIAIKKFIRKINRRAKVDLVAPEGVSSQSKRILEKVGEFFLQQIPGEEHDLIVITDTGHAALLQEQLSRVASVKGWKMLVDHHPLDESMKSLVDESFVDEDASSASEMVYRIFRENSVKIDKQTALVIALGIMADSQFLTIAGKDTIIAMSELVRLGVEPEEVRTMLRYRRDVSEQVARIKGVMRAEFYKAGSWIVATTEVGSYHASVARALMEVGCDVCVAAGTDSSSGETRASVRSNHFFYSAFDMHVGNEVCKKIAERFGGSGGGHPTAGSVNTKANAQQVKEYFLRIVEDVLGERLKKID